MTRRFINIFVLILAWIPLVSKGQRAAIEKTPYFLIAHRGGVVNNLNPDNSRSAAEAAIRQGYYMIEVDLRITKDSIFIIHHAPSFKQTYGVDKTVDSMTWREISKLQSLKGNNKVLRFEELLKLCKGKIKLMIDNKIKGMDTVLFTKLISLLQEYELLDQALMIGTSASTPFFTGKIKLSCTKRQILKNMLKPSYSSSDFYLFATPENLSAEAIKWAKDNHIMVVAIINEFRYSDAGKVMKVAAKDIQLLRSEGVKYFQIDSEFYSLFKD